jgi:hypothetical protein
MNPCHPTKWNTTDNTIIKMNSAENLHALRILREIKRTMLLAQVNLTHYLEVREDVANFLSDRPQELPDHHRAIINAVAKVRPMEINANIIYQETIKIHIRTQIARMITLATGIKSSIVISNHIVVMFKMTIMSTWIVLVELRRISSGHIADLEDLKAVTIVP